MYFKLNCMALKRLHWLMRKGEISCIKKTSQLGFHMKRFHIFPHSLGAKMWHQVSNSLRCIWGAGQKMNVILFLNFRAHLFFPLWTQCWKCKTCQNAKLGTWMVMDAKKAGRQRDRKVFSLDRSGFVCSSNVWKEIIWNLCFYKPSL